MRRKNDVTPFSKILRSLLAERKMKIREAARIAGVAPSTISAWCADGRPENFTAVKKLAKALGVSFTYLLTGEEDESRSANAIPTITEVFDEGTELYNGYARIVMIQMVPKATEKKKRD